MADLKKVPDNLEAWEVDSSGIYLNEEEEEEEEELEIEIDEEEYEEGEEEGESELETATTTEPNQGVQPTIIIPEMAPAVTPQGTQMGVNQGITLQEPVKKSGFKFKKGDVLPNQFITTVESASTDFPISLLPFKKNYIDLTWYPGYLDDYVDRFASLWPKEVKGAYRFSIKKRNELIKLLNDIIMGVIPKSSEMTAPIPESFAIDLSNVRSVGTRHMPEATGAEQVQTMFNPEEIKKAQIPVKVTKSSTVSTAAPTVQHIAPSLIINLVRSEIQPMVDIDRQIAEALVDNDFFFDQSYPLETIENLPDSAYNEVTELIATNAIPREHEQEIRNYLAGNTPENRQKLVRILSMLNAIFYPYVEENKVELSKDFSAPPKKKSEGQTKRVIPYYRPEDKDPGELAEVYAYRQKLYQMVLTQTQNPKMMSDLYARFKTNVEILDVAYDGKIMTELNQLPDIVQAE